MDLDRERMPFRPLDDLDGVRAGREHKRRWRFSRLLHAVDHNCEPLWVSCQGQQPGHFLQVDDQPGVVRDVDNPLRVAIAGKLNQKCMAA